MTKTEKSFREFMDSALYDPVHGYYTSSRNPISEGGDYVTAPMISDVFSFALTRLVREFETSLDHIPSSIVDVGCGDGRLIRSIAADLARDDGDTLFFGVDRGLARSESIGRGPVEFVSDLSQLPVDRPALILCNELYDSFPFARLVQRGDRLRELWVQEQDDTPGWIERPAPMAYGEYFESHGIRLEPGQFADVSLEWSEFHRRLCTRFEKGLVVVFDYGFEAEKLFDPRIRRFGTAASYSGHQVHRDLLRRPGGQDLTAHVNFSDLMRMGDSVGWQQLAFSRQAEFLLKLGITEHPDLAPVDTIDPPGEIEKALAVRERREAARRLILPDGIGQEIAVLVQTKGLPLEGWSFQRSLW